MSDAFSPLSVVLSGRMKACRLGIGDMGRCLRNTEEQVTNDMLPAMHEHTL